MNAKSETSTLIEYLTDDLAPVKLHHHAFMRALCWTLMSVLYVGLVYLIGGAIGAMHVRADIFEKFHDAAFLFENILVFLIGASAAYSAAWLVTPDAGGEGRQAVHIVPPVLLCVFLLWNIVNAILQGTHGMALHITHCAPEGLIFAFVPAMIGALMIKGAATTRPVMLACMNVVSLGAFGYIGLRLGCPLDTVGHAFIYHSAPFILMGIAFSALARCIFRW